MSLPGRTYIARHGETVFNAARRMQGDTLDTPLTLRGIAQAQAMGADLAIRLPNGPPLSLWSSPSGRALQTMAIVAEHIQHDWQRTRHDTRLYEMHVGQWAGRTYADIMRDQGDILDPHLGLFSVRPPDGEWYDDIAARLHLWIAEAAKDTGDRLVIMHGISSRVLRGILTGLPSDPLWRAPIAPALPQGTLVMIADGVEHMISLPTAAQ